MGKTRKCLLSLGSHSHPSSAKDWQEAKGKERDQEEQNQAGHPLFLTGSTETQRLKSFFMNLSSGPKVLVQALLTSCAPGLSYRTTDFIQSC